MLPLTASWQTPVVLALGLALPFGAVTTLIAQDFRVDTDVYLGGEEETFSEHLTIFYGPIVYDFAVKGPEEITILNLREARITLLDVKRRVKTDVKTAELLDFSARIKLIGKKNQDEELVDPEFEVRFDGEQQTLELVSRKISYRTTVAEPTDPTVATRYREFTDWYVRLNSMRPGNPPPFGRLALNRELADRKLIPTEIKRTVTLGRLLAKPQRARSRHLIGMTISNTDRLRIDKAGEYLSDFKTVSPEEYMQVETGASRD